MNTLDDLSLGKKLSEDEPFAYNTLIWVFRYLKLKDLVSCSQVCKTWNWIVLDDSLWKDLVVRCCTKHIEVFVENYGDKIRNLEILNPKFLSIENLKEISSKMLNLRTIKLYGCHKYQLQLLAQNHKKLERIYAEVNWGNPTLKLSFIKNLKNLTHLELVTHIEVTEVQDLKKLEKLKHFVFHAPCDESCWQYISEVESIEFISLNADIGTSWDIQLFDSNFFIKGLKNLTKLQINDLPYFHEYDILERIKDLTHIKELVLQNISISRAGTSSFGRQLGDCHNIEKLTLSIFRSVFYGGILDVALENTEILNGVAALKDSLKEFCWIMDHLGVSGVKDFYHLDNATVLKVDKVKQQHTHRSRGPFIAGVAPVPMPKLLDIFQKRLPNTKVSLIDPQNDTVVKGYCFMCNERIMTSQDRMKTYT